MSNFFRKYYLETISIILLLLLIPTYSLINFWQNDEWVYYANLQNFLNSDLSLHPRTAPTFFTIGMMGSLWAYIFKIESIPYLTLLISVANFYLFTKILVTKFNFSKITNILISLILFTNFLHSYSSIGFMTENYLIFFLLLSILFFEKFLQTGYVKYLHWSNVFSILTFFVKQSGIIFLCATVVYFLITKNYQKLKIQFLYLLGLVTFYLVVFPKTPEMLEKNFSLDNFSNLNYPFSLTYGIFIYLAFFTLPLIFLSLKEFIFTQRKKIWLILGFVIISIASYWFLNKYFKPEFLAWEEFPYFENVFERTGFLPRTLNGTKYQFKYNFDFYYYSDVISKISVAFILAILLLNLKKILNVYLISLVGFIILMFFAPPFFDRYILYAIPLFILLLLQFVKDTWLSKLVLIFFIIYQAYFSYFLVKDYILTHNFVWERSIYYAKQNNPFDMLSTGAWTNTYGRNRLDPKYVFSYDSPLKNPARLENYQVIEIKKLDFWGNLFINPEIYIYERK